MRRFLFFFIFFVSGVSGLIYQVAWVRQATLVFGVSVYAYSIVLAAFMGGAALGSFTLRRSIDRSPAPLQFYGWLEAGVAALGLLTSILIVGLMPLYGQIAQSLQPGSSLLVLVRGFFSALALIPPTFLMGATLPAMSRVVAQRTGRIASDIGVLYVVNTLGAAVGCGLAGLVLLPALGTYTTVAVAVGLSLLAALAAGTAATSAAPPSIPTGQPPVEKRPRGGATQQASRADAAKRSARFVLWTYAISGFVALAYEVVWARILAIFTLNAVFSFSIMLTTFLLGLAAGGVMGAWWTRRRRATVAHFGLLQLMIALSALLTIFLFARLPGLAIEDTFGVASVRSFIYFEFLLGFIILILPTTLLGSLFPLVVSVVTQEQAGGLASHIGAINAINTTGAILGSLVAGFVLIPLLGLQWTVIALALINLCLGVVACWQCRDGQTSWWRAPVAASAATAILIVSAPAGYFLGFREGPSEYLVFYEEGVETTVAVFDVPEQNFKVSFVNGRIEVPTDEISMAAFRLLGHLPALLNPDAQSALMLSFGNGIATGSLDTHGVPTIDAVDLSAEQFAAAELYWEENHNVLRSPRLRTHVEDGRNFLLQTSRRYDIITTDATHPTNTSSWALFTREFYEQVKNRLTPNGVFVQWMPFHSLSEEDYRAILRTFQSVFPHTTLWYTGGSHTLLVATPEKLKAEKVLEFARAAETNAIVREELGRPERIAAYLALDEDELRAYVGDGPLVTDSNAYFLPDNADTSRIRAMFE